MMMMMPYSGVMYIVRQYRKLMISFLACNFQDDNTDDDDLDNACCSSVQKPGLYTVALRVNKTTMMTRTQRLQVPQHVQSVSLHTSPVMMSRRTLHREQQRSSAVAEKTRDAPCYSEMSLRVKSHKRCSFITLQIYTLSLHTFY